MAKVKVDSLKPGMVAAADITNMEGMLLLPAGCALTERQIRISKTWGIPEISVQKDGDEVNDVHQVFSTTAIPQAFRTLKARFWQLEDTNPVHREILRLLLRRKHKASTQV